MELRIKEILKEKGIAIKDFTTMMELSAPSVSNFINGKSKPSIDVFERASKVLNVPFTNLFTNDEVTGFVKVKDKVHEINSVNDLKKLIEEIEMGK